MRLRNFKLLKYGQMQNYVNLGTQVRQFLISFWNISQHMWLGANIKIFILKQRQAIKIIEYSMKIIQKFFSILYSFIPPLVVCDNSRLSFSLEIEGLKNEDSFSDESTRWFSNKQNYELWLMISVSRSEKWQLGYGLEWFFLSISWYT